MTARFDTFLCTDEQLQVPYKTCRLMLLACFTVSLQCQCTDIVFHSNIDTN